MSLTDRDIMLFARAAVEHHGDVFEARTPERKAYCLRQHRLAARAYYEQAQQDVRGSGYRVTQRVRDRLWYELDTIAQAEERASSRALMLEAA